MIFSLKPVIFLFFLVLIPAAVYADTTNDDIDTNHDDFLFDDGTVGPVGIVSELYKAHSDLSGIMENHSAGSYEHDYPFTVTYVDEKNKKLVVGIHPMAAISGITYTTNEIQQVLDTSASIKIVYAEFIPETAPSSTQTYYETHCTPDVSPGYINVCKFYANTLIRNGINPADLGPYTIFLETFSNMRNWNTSGDDIEDDDLGSSYGVIPGHTTRNDVATNDDECDTCVITMRNSINISGYDHATLTFWKLIDQEFESGDYLKVEVYNGSSWTEKFKWTSGDNSWQQHTLTLDGTAFNMRVTASINDDNKFGIDNIILKVENDQTPITSADITPPVITVPADITGVPRIYSLGYYAEFTVTATDDIDSTVNVTCNHSTGYFSIGVTTVNCSATDVSGNRATASFTITVTDGRPVDTDGDGFHDGIDQCPAVASSVNYGCPATTTIPTTPSATEFYGGNEYYMAIKNSTGTYYKPSTLTIGATNSSGVSGVVVSGHGLKINSGFTFVEHTIGNNKTKITSELVPVYNSGNVDAAFIPITEPNIIVGNKIQALNGTVFDVTQGLLSDVNRGETLNIYGIKSNGAGILLFKNATIVDRVFQHTNMGLAQYPSISGDSGAPIIYHHGDKSKLVGVHEGAVCIFEALSENQSRVDVSSITSLCDYTNYQHYYKTFSAWENVKSVLNLQ